MWWLLKHSILLHGAEDAFSTEHEGGAGTGRALKILHIQMFIKVVPSKFLICFAAVLFLHIWTGILQGVWHS